jgi:nitrite reductase/ring-hydroxylating ferredoxin subunit
MDDLVDDKVVGHVGSEEVLLVRSGSELFAVGAHCSHYHGPLADGIVVGHSVRCPWHHACFDLRSGEAVRAPALAPVDCWTVEQRDARIFVKGKREPARAPCRR